MSSEDYDDSEEYDEDEDEEEEEDELLNSGLIKFGLKKEDFIRRHALFDEHSRQCKQVGYNTGRYDDELEALYYVSTNCKPFLDAEGAQARGIDLESDIVISVQFKAPRLYMYSKPTIRVRQTKMKKLNEIRNSHMHTFGLWWPLEDRLKKFIDSHYEIWRKQCNSDEELVWKVTQSPERFEGFLEMIGATGLTGEQRLAYTLAFKASKGDTMKAMEVVNNKKKMKNFSQQAKKVLEELDAKTKTNNPLIQIVQHVQEVVKRITGECLICGKKQNVILFKPTVCEEQLCNFSFLEIGMGVDIESEIRFSPEVVDLLIALTWAGAHGRKDHFSPFPMVDEKVTNQTDIAEIIKKMPAVKEMAQMILDKTFHPTLKELEPSNNNIYRLLRWILCSNKCHLELVPKELQFKDMNTDLQFVLKSTPPEVEKRFRELKKEYGSFYGFHGSPIGNWHSILRNGLVNKAYAQAYGPGIYHARDAQTSVGYLYRGGMGSGKKNWEKSVFGTNDLKCMAMCEIIDWSSKESKCRGKVHHIGCHHKKSSPYIRVEDDTLLVTRFFFVWNQAQNPRVTFVADKNKKMIQNTVDKLTKFKK